MKIIDLSLTLRAGMRGVDYETQCTVARDGWNARRLHLYSHCGTHMDAPTHFDAGDRTIDKIPLDRCLGPAWVVPLRHLEPRALIGVADLGPIATRVAPADGLLLHTGWSHHIDRPEYYRDHFPRVSESLARWCVDRKIRMIGLESPSVADVNNLSEVTLIHKILLTADILIVEGLDDLSRIAGERVLFGAFPLKIEGGDGCPCRAFVIESPSFDPS